MSSLGFLGPLGEKLQMQGDRLDKRFCEVKGALGRIAANSYPEHLRNDFAHKSISPLAELEAGEFEGYLENDTGYDWLIRAVASTGKVQVFWGANHKGGFLAELPANGSIPNCKWFLPAGSKLFIISDSMVTATNLQVEMIRTPNLEADTGISSERYDTIRLDSERPTANIFEE